MRNFILLIIATIGLVSCSADEVIDDINSTSLESLRPNTWQAQVEYGKRNNQITRSDTGKEMPCLVQERYLGQIKSQSEIDVLIEELLADDAVTVLYTIDYSDFDILQVKDVKEAAKELKISDPFQGLKSKLNTQITVGMELIKLEWLFKGKMYNTTAIASNDLGGIIYDAIGSAVIAKRESDIQSNKTMQQNSLPFLKTRSENNANMQVFHIFDTGYSMLGFTLWSYDINVRSLFNAAGVLSDRSVNGRGSSHDLLWSCKAEAKSISGVLNSDKYHEFAWGYVYGMGSISLTFGGSGFTVSGGSSNGVGTMVHRGGAN